jgi:hypothetical protein
MFVQCTTGGPLPCIQGTEGEDLPMLSLDPQKRFRLHLCLGVLNVGLYLTLGQMVLTGL